MVPESAGTKFANAPSAHGRRPIGPSWGPRATNSNGERKQGPSSRNHRPSTSTFFTPGTNLKLPRHFGDSPPLDRASFHPSEAALGQNPELREDP